MAKPKEITAEKYGELYKKYYKKAEENASAAGLPGYEAYWFSVSFSPYTLTIKQTGYKNGVWPHRIHHYTRQPCNKFCQKKLPMATCLIIQKEYDQSTNDYRQKFYVCRHKVGNCPWKV